jgi:hypothetical protein
MDSLTQGKYKEKKEMSDMKEEEEVEVVTGYHNNLPIIEKKKIKLTKMAEEISRGNIEDVEEIRYVENSERPGEALRLPHTPRWRVKQGKEDEVEYR